MLTPSHDDPNKEAEDERKKKEPQTFQPGNYGKPVTDEKEEEK